MAEIKFKYREGYCDLEDSGCDIEYCRDCHGPYAGDTLCKNYNDGNNVPHLVPYGDCTHAKYKYKYKGVKTNNYECEYFFNKYDPSGECILLTIGNIGKKTYECVEVFIDGVKVFSEEEDKE